MLPLLLMAGAAITAAAVAAAGNETSTAHVMEEIGTDPQRLEMFLRAMPKGGDLHMHLAGAVAAESMIGWAATDHLCVDRVSLSIVGPPCREPNQIPVEQAIDNEDFYHRLIDIMSMRDFVPGLESGHDHFFDAFGHFQVVSLSHGGDMVAEVAAQAAAEHVQYLEIMVSPQMLAAINAGKHTVAAADDFQGLSRELAQPIEAILARANADIAGYESQKNQVLKCGTPEAAPGCQVTVRYLGQVLRSFPPGQVFAQDLLAFRLAESNPLVVGINLVQPEDNREILQDYAFQMKQLAWLHEQHPKVKQTLHAGELALGLVPPSDLSFHIRQAVEVAGALRIGHGVDITHEDDAVQLLQRMARDHVMVEINLTSNDLILGVRGAEHPFMTYRAYGVPMALSSDDQGVSRIDLTHEYLRAVTTYHLSYTNLKELSRNSLEYAFLSGPSLWRSAAPYRVVAQCVDLDAPGCMAFLHTSDKARVQAALEKAYQDFEASNSRSKAF